VRHVQLYKTHRHTHSYLQTRGRRGHVRTRIPTGVYAYNIPTFTKPTCLDTTIHILQPMPFLHTAKHCNTLQYTPTIPTSYRSTPSVLQCVAVCCSVLQCVAMCCSALMYMYLAQVHKHKYYMYSSILPICTPYIPHNS